MISKNKQLLSPEFCIQAIVEGANSVKRFYANLAPAPCYAMTSLASELGLGNLYISDQSLRFGLNSFKGIGACYAVSQILDQNKIISTLCTATDGNHGRAVAYAAHRSELKAVIVVPRHTSIPRIEAIKAFGATVIQTEFEYDDAVKHASNLVTQNGASWILIQDTAWEGYCEIPTWIMQGYLQIGFELNDLFPPSKPQVDQVILQVGVGSLAAAIVAFLVDRYGDSAPELICVEPSEADCLSESVHEKAIVTTKKSQQTIMAGLNCGTPSLLAYPILSRYCSQILTVEDDWVSYWMKRLFSPQDKSQIVVSGESGAAVGMAALEKLNKQSNSKKRVLLLNTEGATDPDSFKAIVGNIP